MFGWFLIDKYLVANERHGRDWGWRFSAAKLHLFFIQQMVELKKCLASKCLQFDFGTVDNLQLHLAKDHRLKMTGLSGLATANVSNIKVLQELGQLFIGLCKLQNYGHD